ncbi:BlaI/MecI/CopY family transcriptional regulator [Leifsonia flava]|uniref:Transcriptional regulator n=1 Tax=Orlajensenia leifsoniae TaxID=2561933 RepID=A0A4Y9R6X4_9MICO|nr:BlaI/MecI/CopY family transcriptional regulator [Leifsonia flava]TFV99266.1 transcriptional regulator [Leifsonia flava]
MATLGDLERAVMDLLWDAATPLTANELRAALEAGGAAAGGRDVAATTVLTVLSRLETKGFVDRTRESRPHLYTAVSGRAEHTAELMHEVLGTASDRDAALARFVGQVSPEEAEMLRTLLASRDQA